MKKRFLKAIPLILSVVLVLGLAVNANASFSDFKDVKGHWAEATLRQAYNDQILKGYDATTMAPNSSVTTVQAVTILCRVMNVEGKGNISDFNIPYDAWYVQDVAKAVYAGLLDKSDAATLNDPITRGDAFVLFCRAFQMAAANPDFSVLKHFPDAAYLTGEKQQAAASLVQSGIVNGSDNGMLDVDRSLTRAEFATLLYRLADVYSAGAVSGQAKAGTVVTGNVAVADVIAGNVWFDYATSQVDVSNASVSQLVIRSDFLKNVNISGVGKIGRLVLANGSGNVNLNLPDLYSVGTLVVGQGKDTVTASGDIGNVEITDSGRKVTINSSIDSLIISGSNNVVSLGYGCSVGDIIVRGAGNSIELNASADTLLLAGRDNVISGSGTIAAVNLNTKYYTLDVNRGTVSEWSGFDISGVDCTLTAPDSLSAGAVLKAKATLSVPKADEGKLCVASWYINDELLAQQAVVLGKDSPSCAIQPTYTHNMNLNGTVKLVLSYTNSDGDVFKKEATAPVKLETFSDLGLADTVITVHVPKTLAAGQTLKATATVSSPENGKVCKGWWYVDGKDVASGPLTLGKGDANLSFDYDYYYGMPETSTVKLVLTYTTADGRQQSVSGEAKLNVQNFADNGIAHATATLSAPTSIEPNETLNVTANLKYPEAGKACVGDWYVDGQKVASQNVVLGKDTPKLSYKYPSATTSKTSTQVKFVLSYITEDGRAQQVTATANVSLKNSAQEILNMVTSTYAGDYTLKWALNHDYSKDVKTAWVNLKGYKSDTKYLVWVNLTYQRVNIFEGSQGNWKLIRECLCGSGKASTPTIKGVFTTSYKQTSWNYGSYYCGPIVRFYGSSGYAFHSRLEYWPMNSDRYYDARIGFPVSHGCLRMYNDDIWYMYNNIPNGTTVVVH